MLILSRKVNESILIGSEEVTVTVVSIHRHKVVLGIEAPKGVPIVRAELVPDGAKDGAEKQRQT